MKYKIQDLQHPTNKHPYSKYNIIIRFKSNAENTYQFTALFS